MRPTTIALAALALALVFEFATPRAEAQVLTSSYGYGSWAESGAATFSPVYVPSYSYWTAAYYGYPPRVYAGYGSNDFPYYGRPYGSPSDPWSWPAMAGYSYGVPTRYNLWVP